MTLQIPRFIVSGKLMWQETCAAAVNAKAQVWDSDIGPDDSMGVTYTKVDGTYLTSVPKRDVSAFISFQIPFFPSTSDIFGHSFIFLFLVAGW